MPFEPKLEDLVDFSDNADELPPASATQNILNTYKEESAANLRTTASDYGYANQQISITNMSSLMMGVPLYKDQSIPLSQSEYLQSGLLGSTMTDTEGDRKLGAGFDELVPSDIKKQAASITPKAIEKVRIDPNTFRILQDGQESSDGSGGDGTAGQVPGSDNRTQVWNMLRKNGLTKEQTAGVMGNLYQESGNTWDPRVVEFGFPNGHGGTSKAGKPDTWSDDIPPNANSAGQPGYGICQWTAPSRKEHLQNVADRMGKKAGTIEVQITFLWEELNTEPFKTSTLTPLKAVNTTELGAMRAIDEAAKIFLYHFEAGAGAGREPSAGFRQYLSARQGFAKTIYGEYKDKEVGGQVPSGGAGNGQIAVGGQGSTGLNVSTETLRGLWAPACPAGNLAQYTLFGGGVISYRKGITEAVKALDACLKKANYATRKGDTGAYNCRRITGGTGYSLHAFGIAIDINWNSNPYGPNLVTDMPAAMIANIKKIRTKNGKQVWRWGGDYRSNKDAMHFEVICGPGDLLTGLDPATLT